MEPTPAPALNDPTKKNGTGPGAHPVSVTGITVVIAYLALFAALLLYLLVALWPVPTPSGEPVEHAVSSENQPQENPTPAATPQQTATPVATSQLTTPPGTRATASPATTSATTRKGPSTKTRSTSNAEKQDQMEPVYIFGCEWKIADEVRLLMLVICAGALGSLVHGLRSIYWYVGQRELVWSWIAKYLLLPFTGSVLAVLFYFVVRGGFFSPRAGFADTSPFGFAALAAMVGMFSEQAVLKLKEISETLLSKPPTGKNADSQGVGAKPGAKT